MLIRHYQRPGPAERRDHPDVRQVAGREDQPGLHAGKRGQFPLKLKVKFGGAGNEARGCGTCAPPRQGVRGRFRQARVRGQAQIVVAGQIDEAFVGSTGEGPADQAPAVPHPGLPLEPLGHGGTHAAPPRPARADPTTSRAPASWTSVTAPTMPAVIWAMSAAVLMYGGIV
ncbi:hypothetical protein D9M69_604770 [compost metagenome]